MRHILLPAFADGVNLLGYNIDTRWLGVDWIFLTGVSDQWSSLVNGVINLRVK
jgi:hypothetical protein